MGEEQNIYSLRKLNVLETRPFCELCHLHPSDFKDEKNDKFVCVSCAVKAGHSV